VSTLPGSAAQAKGFFTGLSAVEFAAVAALGEILAYLDALLEPDTFADYAPNGLQVPGRGDVQTVATGVTAHVELFERAREESADLVLAHHGILWEGDPRAISPPMAQRLRTLFDADMSLAAYHLPLDGHPEVGNNALIAKGLGAASHEPFGEHRGRAIGRAAYFDGDGIATADLIARVRALTDREPLVFPDGPERVRSVGIVSGAGADNLAEAIDRGLDAFLTGEPAERVMAQAREAGVHFIAAGHYATETFGIRALGERLAERFGVRHVFVDVPNPI
jgi:dinuclear metal center YbgI/SA1388 family protein